MFPQRSQSDLFNMLPLNPYNKRKLYEELQATSTYFDEKPKCKFIEECKVEEITTAEVAEPLLPLLEDQLQTESSNLDKSSDSPLQSQTLEIEQLDLEQKHQEP